MHDGGVLRHPPADLAAGDQQHLFSARKGLAQGFRVAVVDREDPDTTVGEVNDPGQITARSNEVTSSTLGGVVSASTGTCAYSRLVSVCAPGESASGASVVDPVSSNKRNSTVIASAVATAFSVTACGPVSIPASSRPRVTGMVNR